jgi:hypothetical protein
VLCLSVTTVARDGKLAAFMLTAPANQMCAKGARVRIFGRGSSRIDDKGDLRHWHGALRALVWNVRPHSLGRANLEVHTSAADSMGLMASRNACIVRSVPPSASPKD